MIRTRLTLGRKIGVFTLVALSLGLGLFSVLAIQSVNESVQKTLDQRLEIARIVASHIDQTLNYVLFQIHGFTASGPIVFNEQGFKSATSRLQNIFDQSQINLKSVYALDPNGVVIQSEPSHQELLGMTVSIDNNIKTRLENGEPGVSGLESKPLSESPVVLIWIPVLDDNSEVTWLLACSVEVEQLGISTFVKNIEIGDTGYIEIVDSNGIVLVRTNPGTPPTSFESSDHPTRFAELILSGEAIVGKCHVCHTAESSTPQRRDVLAFAPLSAVPWGVAIRQSEKEALLPTRQLEVRLLSLGSIFLLSTVAVVVSMIQSIIKPIRMLTTAADRLAVNDYEAAIPADRGDEIGQLSGAFHSMRTELKKSRKEMVSRYEEARHREELRGHLLNSVINAQEQERRRIARELHDEYGQTLTGLLMTIESVENTLPGEQRKLRERLTNTKSVVGRAIDEMRQLILNLRPPSLDELGLVAAVKTYSQRQLGEHDINVNFEVGGLNNRLPPALEITLFRIIQEVVHNIIKHAHAHNVNIQLLQQDNKIITMVEDDGCGFNPEVVLVPGIKTTSWGIIGIRERTELMGGTFSIKSTEGKGTRFEVDIPLDERLWGSTDQTILFDNKEV